MPTTTRTATRPAAPERLTADTTATGPNARARPLARAARRLAAGARRLAGTARRVGAVLAALVLGAALVAGVPVPAASAVTGALGVTGDPLVHTFDLDRPGDAVTGEWRVSSRTSGPIAFDGVLRPDGEPGPGLAAALAVEYGSVGPDGAVTAWHDAGTLAAPRSYADALGSEPAARGGAPVVVPVRVSLPDPAAVTGAPGGRVEVTASFVVSYLAPDGPGGEGGPGGGGAGGDGAGDGAGAGPGGGGGAGGGTADGTRRPVLAITGTDAWWLAALAAAALGTGTVLVRRRRGARDTAVAPTSGS